MMNDQIALVRMEAEMVATASMNEHEASRFRAWTEPLKEARKDPEIHELLLNVAVLSALDASRLSPPMRRRFSGAIVKGIDGINVRAP